MPFQLKPPYHQWKRCPPLPYQAATAGNTNPNGTASAVSRPGMVTKSSFSPSRERLSPYFREVASALLNLAPTTLVLDGDIVTPVNGELSFDQSRRLPPYRGR